MDEDSSKLIADLKLERAEISDRAWKLAKFLDSHAIEISGDQQSAMRRQWVAMNAYTTALDERINDLEVEIDD